MSDLLVHIKITHQKCSILRYKFEKTCEHCGTLWLSQKKEIEKSTFIHNLHDVL